MNTRPISIGVITVTFIASLVAWPGPSTQALATNGTTFSGRATALKATILGTTVGPLADTGEVNPEGDSLDATFFVYPIPGVFDPTNGALSAEVLHAAVIAHGNRSSAEASAASFSLSAAMHSVAAEFLMARAAAMCNGNTATVSGSAEVAGLTIDGQKITVSGQANQTITLPGGAGQIVINEQTTDSSLTADKGGITVNALHVTLTGVADVTVASAHADIACGGTPPCSNQDFVTGGGWITTASGSRANFALTTAFSGVSAAGLRPTARGPEPSRTMD